MNHTKRVSRFMETKGKHASFKPSPDDGKQANHFSRSKATLQKCVRRFALAKVAAEPSEGASVIRNEKTVFTERQ